MTSTDNRFTRLGLEWVANDWSYGGMWEASGAYMNGYDEDLTPKPGRVGEPVSDRSKTALTGELFVR